MGDLKLASALAIGYFAEAPSPSREDMRKGLFMVSAYFLTMMQQKSTSLAFTILTLNITIGTYLISFILLPLS